MGASTRRRVTVLLALTAFACAVAVAVAASVKVNAPRSNDSDPETYVYAEGSGGASGGSGQVGACVNGTYTGGSGQFPPSGGSPGKLVTETPCQERTGDTTLPDAVTGCNTVEECQAEHGGGGGGGGEPAPPCDGAASCEALVRDTLPEGGGGGPAPPCSDDASCLALIQGLIPDGGGGAPGAPTTRDCTSASGGEATCVDFGNGTFLVGDSPQGDNQGELGVCTSSGYFYVAGPSKPAGAPGATCPAGGTDTGEQEPSDGGGDPAPPEGGGGGAPSAPTTRDCTSSNGGEATCVDFGAGNYLVGDSPDDGQGELGFCTASEQAPMGRATTTSAVRRRTATPLPRARPLSRPRPRLPPLVAVTRAAGPRRLRRATRATRRRSRGRPSRWRCRAS